MIKELFSTLLLVAFKPEKGWRLIYNKYLENPRYPVQETYYFPALGVLCLTAFVGELLNAPTFNILLAIKAAVLYLIIAMLSYYAGFLGMAFVAKKWLGFTGSKNQWELFTFYAYSPIYLMTLVYLLVPQLRLLTILMLYSVYVVWQGVVYFWKFPEEKLFSSTIAFSVLLFLLAVGSKLVLSHLSFFS